MQRELTFEEKLDCLEYMIININKGIDWFICCSFDNYMVDILNINMYNLDSDDLLTNIKFYFPELYILIISKIKKSNKYINRDLNIISTQYIKYILHTKNDNIMKLYKSTMLIKLMVKLTSKQLKLKT